MPGTSNSAAPSVSGGAADRLRARGRLYDEELTRAVGLIEDLRSLSRANMEDEAERFAMALASDSILPGDF